MRVMSLVVCLLLVLVLPSCTDAEKLARLSADVQRLEGEKTELAKQLDETKTALAAATAQVQSCDTAKLSCMEELGKSRAVDPVNPETPEKLYKKGQKFFADGDLAKAQSALEQVIARGACSKWGKRAEADLEKLKQYTGNVRYVYKLDGLAIIASKDDDYGTLNFNVDREISFDAKVTIYPLNDAESKQFHAALARHQKLQQTGNAAKPAEDPTQDPGDGVKITRKGDYKPSYIYVTSEEGSGYVDGNYLGNFPAIRFDHLRNFEAYFQSVFGEPVARTEKKGGTQDAIFHDIDATFPLGAHYESHELFAGYNIIIELPFLTRAAAFFWMRQGFGIDLPEDVPLDEGEYSREDKLRLQGAGVTASPEQIRYGQASGGGETSITIEESASGVIITLHSGT